MDPLLFNKNRQLALFLGLISAILAWYCTVLLTNKVDNTYPIPNINQVMGLLLGMLIGIGIWIKKCLTIKPY